MRTDTKGLLHVLTTGRTLLRGVSRCNGNHLTPSTFSLGFKVLPEHPPGCIGYGIRQTMVTYHVGNSQIFNGYGLIHVNIISGGFVKSIFALVGDMLMNASDKMLGLLAAVAPLFAFSKFALCTA